MVVRASFAKICGNDNAGVLAVALHRQDLDIGVHAGLCLRTLRFVAVGASSTCLQTCLGTLVSSDEYSRVAMIGCCVPL